MRIQSHDRSAKDEEQDEISLERQWAARIVTRFNREQTEQKRASEDIFWFLEQCVCVDTSTGRRFSFELMDPAKDWYWQREILESWQLPGVDVTLKARQLGLTWLAAGKALHTALFHPGTMILVVSIKETEAIKVVRRVWSMYHSLPDHLRAGAKIVRPSRSNQPTSVIDWGFPDGRISSLEALTSSPTAGHGVSARFVILDEFARQEYASDTWKAVLPTVQTEGTVAVISTANGVSTEDGRGNNFHYVYSNAATLGLRRRFLPWNTRKDRDERWYRENALSLRSEDRGEQYPANELEAFIVTGRPYFDTDALLWYSRQAVREPLYRFDFLECSTGNARRARSDAGFIRVYQAPVDSRSYAIGVDPSTGSGPDFSAVYVLDLSEMLLAAELHGKLDSDLLALQLHYLGRWYNNALIAVESGGGYGTSVISELRSPRRGRPAYPRLYRHLLTGRPGHVQLKTYGYPMNAKTRPKALAALEEAVRERLLPSLTSKLLSELRTFVWNESGRPQAISGGHDDCVMAAAIALDLYGTYGSWPDRHRSRRPERRRTFLELYGEGLTDRQRDLRYRPERSTSEVA